jgi:phage major head subunit gpT-like protein
MNPKATAALLEAASKIDFKSPSLSFRALREAAVRISELHEANTESSFGFLLRSAVQEFANDVYKDLPVSYPNFVTEVTSKRRSEIYGGLYRPNLPRQVDAGEKFQDQSFKGFERELVNYKFGHIETFERELFDDDQTGQVRSRSANLGEGFRLFEEIYVMTRLFGVAATQDGIDVSASSYQNAGVTGTFTVAIGNRPAAFGRLSAATLEAAIIAMMSQTDPTGRKFLVTPTMLLVNPIDLFEAKRLMNSPASAYNQTLSAPGVAGMAAGMINPLQGMLTVYSSPYVPAKAWMIGDPKKGFVFQRRDPLEIIQENPQSGQSFIQEVYAFRARERFECDWIEPRFAYVGDDGSV